MRAKIAYAAAVMLTLAACNKGDKFRVSGVIDGAGSRPIELMYCPAGAARVIKSHAVDGKFIVEGEATRPALAFISIGGEQLITLIVENGDEIECKLSLSEPLLAEVNGSKVNERLSKFIRSNAKVIAGGNPRLVNPLVAEFVKKNSDNYAATAAMLTLYQSAGYETAADSLMSIISPKARPAAVLLNFTATLATQLAADTRSPIQSMSLVNNRDSIIRYNPFRHSVTLLAFVGTERDCRDSVVPVLRKLRAAYPVKRLETIEISTATDSATWRKSVANDSAKWAQVWAPGTVASPALRKLNVARSPFFIVVDSTGTQLIRTPSLSVASEYVLNYLK